MHSLLARLLGDEALVERLLARLKSLPSEAMGTWCCGGPLYADDRLNLSNINSAELYQTSASLFDASFWRQIDQQNSPDEDLATWLNQDLALTQSQRQARTAYQTFKGNSKYSTLDALAQKLLMTLGGKHTRKVADNVVTCRHEVVLLHGVYAHYNVYTAETKMPTQLAKQQPGLWLCVSDQVDTGPLPGIKVSLNSRQCLSLLHTRDQQEALARLNQYAAVQHRIEPHKVFRAAGGMGEVLRGLLPEMVVRHFHGRDALLSRMLSILDDADKGNNSSVVITGSRRMGKTSLRQRFSYLVKRDQPERACINVDLQNFPDLGRRYDQRLTPIEVEYRFFSALEWAFKEHDYAIDLGWRSKQKGNSAQRDKARRNLMGALSKLKLHNKTPVIFLDETEAFMAYDETNNWEVMRFLRELTSKSLLCLFATSYPHGRGVAYSLTMAMHSTAGAAFNLFAHGEWRLTPWRPNECWRFLQEKLAGFGIVLPFSRRTEVLALSQGCPWIIHTLGKHICENVTQTRIQRVMLETDWAKAKQATLKDIQQDLHSTIEDVALKNDRLNQVDMAQNPTRCLANKRLWDALTYLAEQQKWNVLKNEDEWSDPQIVSIDEIAQRLGHTDLAPRIQRVCNLLTGSIVFEGDPTSDDHFFYSSNLLPMVAQSSRGNYEMA